MKNKISIITASLNQGKYIKKTLDSISSQKNIYFNIEHIVMDGGSKDETSNILRNYESNFNFKWFSEKDNGQSNAINNGIRLSSGEIIGWLNSDDMYFEDTISIVVDFFDKHKDVNVLYGRADHINEDDQFLNEYLIEKWNLERLKQNCFICQPSVFIRRSFIDKIGLLNENLNFCMDYEYWLRIASYGDTPTMLDKKLSMSRMYGANKTNLFKHAVHVEIVNMLFQKYGKVHIKWILDLSSISTSSIKNNYVRIIMFMIKFILNYSKLFINKKI